MARQDFIDQLKALGFAPEDLGANRVSFPYTIPVGKFIGQQIKLGFVVGVARVRTSPESMTK